MPKLPVGRTIEAAYSFAFRHFFAVLAILWFPYLAVIAIGIGLALLMAPGFLHAFEHGSFDPAALPGLIGLGVLLWLGLIVAGAMVRVGLMRKALGMEQGRIFLYFSFATPVWRMLGAMILAGLVIVGVGLASAAAVGIVWGIGHALLAAGAARIIGGVAGFVAILWMIYAVVRLIFFLPAVVVAEEQIGLGRAWTLGGGNFWRIFIAMLAIFIPVFILFGIVGAFTQGLMFMPAVEPHSIEDVFKSISERWATIGPLSALLNLVYVTLLAGLSTGAIAGAYTAIVPAKPGAHGSPAETAHT